eukprot:GHVN01083748.1.p1 GENE.GHVN01083748.1~~GHVN01083748.1.p1  ORF type:complete len:134 (-),score=20.86 GHVN01083748.1:66-467(-)
MGDNEQWKFYCPFCDTTIESASRHAGSSQHLSWYRNKDNAEWNKKHPKCARELFGMRTKAAKDSVGTKDEGKLWDDVIIKLCQKGYGSNAYGENTYADDENVCKKQDGPGKWTENITLKAVDGTPLWKGQAHK